MYHVNATFEFLNATPDNLTDHLHKCYGKVMDFKWWQNKPDNGEQVLQFYEGKLCFSVYWERFIGELLSYNISPASNTVYPTTFLLSCGTVNYAVSSQLPEDWAYYHMIQSHAEELPFYCGWCDNIMSSSKYSNFSPRQKLTKIVSFALKALGSKYDNRYVDCCAFDHNAMTNAARRMDYVTIWNETADRPFSDSDITSVQTWIEQNWNPQYKKQTQANTQKKTPSSVVGRAKRGLLY